MGNVWLSETANWLRAAGVSVVEVDGWQTRSRSSGGYEPGRPLCVMWHHTASTTDPASDCHYMCHGADARPVANVLIARDGSCWVMAAGATNTNGSGRSIGFSRGTVPADSMNSYAFGMEIANSGTGEHYPQAQIDAAFRVSNTMNARLGNQPGDVSTHQFYAPDRKIDPAMGGNTVEGLWHPGECTNAGSWNRDDLVSECNNRAGEDDDDMPSAAEVAKAVWAEPCVSEVDGETYPVGVFVPSTHAAAHHGTAAAVWNDPRITSEVDGREYEPYVFLKSIHGMVADIQQRLAALEEKV